MIGSMAGPAIGGLAFGFGGFSCPFILSGSLQFLAMILALVGISSKSNLILLKFMIHSSCLFSTVRGAEVQSEAGNASITCMVTKLGILIPVIIVIVADVNSGYIAATLALQLNHVSH